MRSQLASLWVFMSLVRPHLPQDLLSSADLSPSGMQRPYNISLYPGTGCADGKSGDHIILAPAYNITADEISQVVDTTVTVIERFFSEMEVERDADDSNGHK